jgi:acyl dehydratase
MSKTVVVRYRTRPEAADENARLVEGVYAELADVAPADFHYTTYRLADDVTFVHVAVVDGPVNPLTSLPAFAEFQRELGQRCAEGPVPSDATVVGSYGSGR